MLRGLFKSISSNMMGGDVATIEDNELVSEKLKADREALSGGARNVNNAINNALDLNTIVNADYKGIGQKALGVTKNYLNTYGSDPNQPLQTQQQQQTQQLHRAIIQEAQNSIETTLGKKSADLTIGSGLKGESLAQAGQNTKADIISGKKAPGFFEGIAGFVGDFARSEAGTTLLSGIAGQAVGREFGISDTAGFLQGASGGQQAIAEKKKLALENTKQQALLQTQLNKTLKEGKDRKLDGIKLERDLRNDFEKSVDVKEYQILSRNAGNIDIAMDQITERGDDARISSDEAIIASFKKVLDPPSVVRESEFARTGKALGLGGQVIGASEKLYRSGTTLQVKDLKEIQLLVGKIMEERTKGINVKATNARRIASEGGLKADNVAKLFTYNPTTTKPTNKKGTEKSALPVVTKTKITPSGYKYKVRSK